jgi:hypothetical protein
MSLAPLIEAAISSIASPYEQKFILNIINAKLPATNLFNFISQQPFFVYYFP